LRRPHRETSSLFKTYYFRLRVVSTALSITAGYHRRPLIGARFPAADGKTRTLPNTLTTIMSIFSKVKNAKKAAEQHKRASSQAQAEIKPPTRYKHIPTHAAQDALSCAPTSWSVEESRAKISAAHRRKSDLSRKSSFVRTNSEPAIASRGCIHRTESDLSIDSVITKQRHSSYQSPSPYAYSGCVPPPRIQPYFTHVSSSSSMAMKRSPLSNTSTKEGSIALANCDSQLLISFTEEEGENAESSKNSTHSSTSSRKLPRLQ